MILKSSYNISYTRTLSTSKQHILVVCTSYLNILVLQTNYSFNYIANVYVQSLKTQVRQKFFFGNKVDILFSRTSQRSIVN